MINSLDKTKKPSSIQRFKNILRMTYKRLKGVQKGVFNH